MWPLYNQLYSSNVQLQEGKTCVHHAAGGGRHGDRGAAAGANADGAQAPSVGRAPVAAGGARGVRSGAEREEQTGPHAAALGRTARARARRARARSHLPSERRLELTGKCYRVKEYLRFNYWLSGNGCRFSYVISSYKYMYNYIVQCTVKYFSTDNKLYNIFVAYIHTVETADAFLTGGAQGRTVRQRVGGGGTIKA